MQNLVLVGGGHAHVEVLRRLAETRELGLKVTVISDRRVAIYSGMVPGFVAGQYSASELSMDVQSLAERAGATFVLAAATHIDATARSIQVHEHAPISYDVAALDVGSTVAGTDLPGVRDHALRSRPIWQLVQEVQERLHDLTAVKRTANIVVVGGGAGGVELAFCLQARANALCTAGARITIVDSNSRLLEGASPNTTRAIEREARKRGITILAGTRVRRLEQGSVSLNNDRDIEADIVVWVAGAEPLEFIKRSNLPIDDRGFIPIRPTFQVRGHDNLFAVGDCASLPGMKKAGVYAVRSGPILAQNLRACFRGETLQEYSPQRDFLSLLNLGDGTALGTKWSLTFQGRWVMRLKDRIDRRFMEKYR